MTTTTEAPTGTVPAPHAETSAAAEPEPLFLLSYSYCYGREDRLSARTFTRAQLDRIGPAVMWSVGRGRAWGVEIRDEAGVDVTGVFVWVYAA
ncbi:hypothetical protein ACFVXG_38285 [Kitasatospora sp. NPDC058162]|uniref:hypothetical protein n=1 Tax=Kitasatospora sp. NPDC058162 TaxID=3346362 RepID=UPI0036DEBCD2